MGSYIGNGTVGRTVDFGFEPQWVLIKPNANDHWYLFDSMREWTTDISARLRPDTSDEEGRAFYYIPPNATGITFNASSGGALNANGTEYIYMAIRRPMKTPETGTEVFSPYYGTLGSPITTNFPVDLSINNKNTGSSYSHFYTFTRPLGTYYLEMAKTAAAVDGGTASPKFDVMNSIDLSGWYGASSTVSAFNFKRASKFMDVVVFSGTGANPLSVSHNLTVPPELMIAKRRSGAVSWMVGVPSVSLGGFLNTTDALSSTRWSTDWSGFSPTSTIFKVSDGTAGSGDDIIAYLFATLAGISKVGSVVHSGTTNVDCGFSNGARFVLAKRTDATGEWYFFDTANGIVAGSDNYWINPTGDRLTQDIIDPLASGFTLTSSFTAGTYIFLAIA